LGLNRTLLGDAPNPVGSRISKPGYRALDGGIQAKQPNLIPMLLLELIPPAGIGRWIPGYLLNPYPVLPVDTVAQRMVCCHRKVSRFSRYHLQRLRQMTLG